MIRTYCNICDLKKNPEDVWPNHRQIKTACIQRTPGDHNPQPMIAGFSINAPDGPGPEPDICPPCFLRILADVLAEIQTGRSPKQTRP